MKKYSKYMGDVEHFVSPYHFEKKPLEVFSEKLCDAGFQILHIENRDQMFVFGDIELLKCKFSHFRGFDTISQSFQSADSVEAVNPFTSRMPKHLQSDFLNDYVKKVDEMNLVKFDEKTARQSVLTPYKLMIAIASK